MNGFNGYEDSGSDNNGSDNNASEDNRSGTRGPDINVLTGRIIGAPIEVHRCLGPGLLESAYHACLASELRSGGLRVDRQVPVRVVYRDVDLDCGYRIDMLVERSVVVELKTATSLDPVHMSQVLTYLRLGGYEIGLLLNFNVAVLRSGGIRRVVRGHNIPKPSASSASPRPPRQSV